MALLSAMLHVDRDVTLPMFMFMLEPPMRRETAGERGRDMSYGEEIAREVGWTECEGRGRRGELSSGEGKD